MNVKPKDRFGSEGRGDYFSNAVSHHLAMASIELANATTFFLDLLLNAELDEIEIYATELLFAHEEYLTTVDTELQAVPKQLSGDEMNERFSRGELIRFYSIFEQNRRQIREALTGAGNKLSN
jgi:hypothetical protein